MTLFLDGMPSAGGPRSRRGSRGARAAAGALASAPSAVLPDLLVMSVKGRTSPVAGPAVPVADPSCKKLIKMTTMVSSTDHLQHGRHEDHGLHDHVLVHGHVQLPFVLPHPHPRHLHLHSWVQTSHQLAPACGRAERIPCVRESPCRRAQQWHVQPRWV